MTSSATPTNPNYNVNHELNPKQLNIYAGSYTASMEFWFYGDIWIKNNH